MKLIKKITAKALKYFDKKVYDGMNFCDEVCFYCYKNRPEYEKNVRDHGFYGDIARIAYENECCINRARKMRDFLFRRDIKLKRWIYLLER